MLISINRIKWLTIIALPLIFIRAHAQDDRFTILERRLKDLSALTPGLNEKADLSVNNISIQDFLKGLASTHNLNFNIDPSLNQRVSNYFTDETVSNILLYLARQFNLDFTFIGTIITIAPYNDPRANLPPPPKDIKIVFNDATSTISFDLIDDSLSEVAKKIVRLSGRNIIVTPGLYGKKVTGYVQDLPVESALEKLAISNAFKLKVTNDNVTVLEPLQQDEEIFARESSTANPGYSIRKVNRNNPSPSSSSIEVTDDPGGKKTVTLNVISSPLKEVVRNMAGQAGINYLEYTDLQGNTTATINNMEFERALELILKDTKYTFTSEKGVFLIGDRKDEGLRSQKLIQLQYRSADSLMDIIPMELRQGVEIKEFKELNGLLLSGSGPQIQEIERFIRQIDRVVPMITLEVIILDVNKGKTVSTGISAGISDSSRPGGTLLGSGGLNYTFGSRDINQFLNNIGLNNIFNLGRVSPNFYISLSALENKSNINQRQTPKLSTLNGHTANLSIGNTQYYAISTQNVLGSLNPQTVVTKQFVPVEANLSIEITPYVAGNDEVTMHIGVSISNFTSSNNTVDQPPPTSTSKFKSIIRVRNEEMILLGGIERTTKNETASGIPLLSRIPILKWLFSSRTRSDSKVVSIVFIKPTIFYR
jgi:type IV pilus assembly protein PilQ